MGIRQQLEHQWSVSMGDIRSHRDLIVWQRSMELAVEVYRLSKEFPSDERFRLVDQVTRAVASVPANIAEGYYRSSKKEYARFLAIAMGSLMETQTLLDLAQRLGYLSVGETEQSSGFTTEISKMLTSLRTKLRA